MLMKQILHAGNASLIRWDAYCHIILLIDLSSSVTRKINSKLPSADQEIVKIHLSSITWQPLFGRERQKSSLKHALMIIVLQFSLYCSRRAKRRSIDSGSRAIVRKRL